MQLARCEVRGVERQDLLKALLKEVGSVYPYTFFQLYGGCLPSTPRPLPSHTYTHTHTLARPTRNNKHTHKHTQVATKLLKEEAAAELGDNAPLQEVIKKLEQQRCVRGCAYVRRSLELPLPVFIRI
jgi:hypothetical protein